MRFDVNVSLIDEQTDFQGPRCEVKNVNSMRYAVKAAGKTHFFLTFSVLKICLPDIFFSCFVRVEII